MPSVAFNQKIWGSPQVFNVDFNAGLRLDVPKGKYHVKISDAESGQIYFDKDISDTRLISVEQYYIPWQIEVFSNNKKVFSHTLNFEGQPVCITYTEDTLGDMLVSLPFIREFKKIHRCELSICVQDIYRELVSSLYPDIPQREWIDFKTYATYSLRMIRSPFPGMDVRNMPMELNAGIQLGINYLPPKADFKPTEPPVTNDPYVCIAVQASANRKAWRWSGGWDVVVNYLKSLGYRVFCIDKNSWETNEGMTVIMPEGAEDFTGDHSLIERANMLYHAQFFIGLGSGLAWLADAVACPVVLIAGFSQDWCEFYTPYRVANRFVCNGCFNDIRVNFLSKEKRCPYHQDTPRELECQKKISPRMVINAIERLIIDRGLLPPALA